MLTEICDYLHNYFPVPEGIHPGYYTIAEGGIALPFLQEGQYFRIAGSLWNDGIYRYPAAGLRDESFSGEVWAMALPKAVIDLAEEIAAWQEKHGEDVVTPYTSESFGGYTYEKAADPDTGGSLTWASVFRSRLSRWRKL